MIIYNLMLTTDLGSHVLGCYSTLELAQRAAKNYYRSLDMAEETMLSRWYQLPESADTYYCQLTDSSSGLFDDSTLTIREMPLDWHYLDARA